MKVEEMERLATAATAQIMTEYPNAVFENMQDRVKAWRNLYQRVLSEFINQEKADYANTEQTPDTAESRHA